MQIITVGQLKKIIKSCPDDMAIIIGDDEELNGVHPAFFAQTEDLTDVDGNGIGDLIQERVDTKQFENQTVLLIS